MKKKAHRFINPHIDALVITFLVANITLHRITIKIDSLTNVLFYETEKPMKLSYHIKLVTTLLVGFFRLPLILESSVTLPFTIG